MDALIGGKANVVIQKSNFYHISKIFNLKKKKKKTFGSTFRTEWTIGGLIYIYIYIYIKPKLLKLPQFSTSAQYLN